MGRRIYESGFDTITVGTAVQDLWFILAGAAIGVQLHWMELSAAGVTVATQLRLRLKRGTATVTPGSGGTTPNKNLVDSGDTKVSAATVHANDTSQATTTGNFTGFQKYYQWDLLFPFDYMPGAEDEDRPMCQPNEAWILDFPAAIAATWAVSGFATWREMP